MYDEMYRAEGEARGHYAAVGDWLKAMLPEDPESTILKRLKRKPDEDQPDPGQKSERERPALATQAG